MKFFVAVEYSTKDGKRATKFTTVDANDKFSAQQIAKGLTFGTGSVKILERCLTRSY